MNSRLIGLIILIILSVFLFLFISYTELKDGFDSFVGGGGAKNVATSNLAEGIVKTMNAIDEIV